MCSSDLHRFLAGGPVELSVTVGLSCENFSARVAVKVNRIFGEVGHEIHGGIIVLPPFIISFSQL